MKVSQKKLVIVLDWGLLIVLNIVAAWFASEVFEQFFSKRSSFFQHEEKIDTHPVIVIEFRDFTGPIPLDDVKILYRSECMPKNLELLHSNSLTLIVII